MKLFSRGRGSEGRLQLLNFSNFRDKIYTPLLEAMHLNYRHSLNEAKMSSEFYFPVKFICSHWAVILVHLYVVLGFESPLNTQLLSSRVSPPAWTDVSRVWNRCIFLNNKLMHNFGEEKNHTKIYLINNSQEIYTSISIEKN